jgi:hypothetical protein
LDIVADAKMAFMKGISVKYSVNATATGFSIDGAWYSDGDRANTILHMEIDRVTGDYTGGRWKDAQGTVYEKPGM